MLELVQQPSYFIALGSLFIILTLILIMARTRKTLKKQLVASLKNLQTKQMELDSLRKEYEKRIGDLKERSQSSFKEERNKTDRVLSELEHHKEISRIAAGVSNEQSKKIQSFTEVASELRTPISNIMGSLEDLLAGSYGKIYGKTRRHLENILANARNLLRFVDQFHDISTLQAGKMEIKRSKKDMIQFLREIMQTMAWYAEKRGIQFGLETKAEKLEMNFDTKKMIEVFYHLLSNAFRFTEDNGKILISVAELRADDTDLDEDSVKIKVRNSGMAISEDDVPHVFDVFQRSDNRTRPRFGLSLVKELISLHGGSIQARGEQGIGTEFTIILPKGTTTGEAEGLEETIDLAERARIELSTLESEQTRRRERLRTPREIISSHSLGILVVEDNESLRDLLKSGLREFYKVREARNGVEALEKMREQKPDLVITDAMMPEMDGLTFCRTLKSDASLNQVPVILITANATEGGRIEAMEAGADAYISKPFGFEELLRKIEHFTKSKLTTL